MKNLIMFLAVLIFLAISVVPVFADTDVSVDVQTSEDVNLDVDVNAGGNVDVTIDGTNIGTEMNTLNDSLNALNNYISTVDNNVDSVNDTVNGIYADVYGTSPNSPDGFLEGAENATENPMSDYCSDPELTQHFNTFSSIPPAGFKEYMKSLGYDDEAHINMMWTICQEKRLNSMGQYVGQNEGGWNIDTGILYNDVVSLLQRAVNWLLGLNKTPSNEEKNVATALDSYFASDIDIEYLLLRTQDLHYRVKSLENTMDEIASDAYCQGKLDVLKEYGLESVECGNTTYHNHMKNPITGENMILGITPIEWAE